MPWALTPDPNLLLPLSLTPTARTCLFLPPTRLCAEIWILQMPSEDLTDKAAQDLHACWTLLLPRLWLCLSGFSTSPPPSWVYLLSFLLPFPSIFPSLLAEALGLPSTPLSMTSMS